MVRSRRLWVAGLTATFVLMGCARPSDEEAGEMVDETGIEETGITGDVEPEPLQADLTPVNESGVTGTASLTSRDGQLVVDLTLDGATEGERYVAHVHKGECGNDLGMAAAIGELTVTEGRNRITGSVDGASLDPAQSHFVQAHRGADDKPVACGNLPPIGGVEVAPAGAAAAPAGEAPASQGDTY